MVESVLKDTTWVRSFYDLVLAGNFDAAADYLSDDFELFEAPAMPYAGRYVGKHAIPKLLGELVKTLHEPTIEVIDFALSETRVVVQLEITAKAASDGSPLTVPLCEILEIKDGKIITLTPYYYDQSVVINAAATDTAQSSGN